MPPVRELWSVISVTTALPPVTVLDLADEPGAVDHRVAAVDAVVVPLLIVMRWYQLLGERMIDARVDRPVLAHAAGRVDLVEPRLLLGLAQAVLAVGELRAVARRARLIASSRWSLASIVSPNQPNRSRNGFRTRLAPSWIGESAPSAPRCTECRRPSEDSPNRR